MVSPKIPSEIRSPEVAAGSHFEACELVRTLSPEFDELPKSDERKWRYAKLRIEAFGVSCAYFEAKAAIEEAIDWARASERPWLRATLSEMQLLQGDIDPDEG